MRTRIDVGEEVREAADASKLRLFDPDRTTAITGVRIFDVGQGDCIGLLDQDGELCAYVDYGGYLDHPDRADPAGTKIKIPVRVGGQQVAIILTHWDQDHLYSAHKYNVDAQECEWLTPRQWVSPFAVTLAAKLKDAKCWPESMGQDAHRFEVGGRHVVEIRKCLPFDKKRPREDRNLTGLAITVLELKSGDVTRQMILPGDCPFELIPNLPNVPIQHLVAFHHGSGNHWTPATTATITHGTRSRSMSYSYSPKNTYGHPDRRKYKPKWDIASQATPGLRRKGKRYVDLVWR
jgi:hypothetical protein